MKALIYDGDRISYQDIEHPSLKSYSRPIKIKIQLAGICSTDLNIIDGNYYNKAMLKKNGILGHEGCGYVLEHCTDSSFNIGDHVVFETVYPCQQCDACIKGLTNYCCDWFHIGINANGTFSEYFIVDESMVHKVSKNISPKINVLAEPLSIVLNSITSIFNGHQYNTAAVIGPGLMGLLHAILLMERGLVVDVFGMSCDTLRLEKALGLGANNTFISNDTSKKWQQYDLVIDSSNTCSGAMFAILRCKPGGHLRVLNLSTEKFISASDIVKSGCYISTSKGIQHSHMVAACNYIEANSHKLIGLTTNFFNPDEHQQAFDFVRNKNGIKSVFQFS